MVQTLAFPQLLVGTQATYTNIDPPPTDPDMVLSSSSGLGTIMAVHATHFSLTLVAAWTLDVNMVSGGVPDHQHLKTLGGNMDHRHIT